MKYIICSLLLVFGGLNEEPPKGWTSTQNGTNTDMRPKNLSSKRLFVYTLFPVQQTNLSSLTEWLKIESRKDATKYGFLTQNFTPETVDEIETLTGKVEQNGKQKILMYMAFTANNQYYLARIVTEPDQKMYSPYLSQVAAHFLRLANSEGVNVPALPQDQAKVTNELKEVLQNY